MPISKQRLDKESNKPHHESGQQELLHPVKIAPTKSAGRPTLWVGDFQLKESMKTKISGMGNGLRKVKKRLFRVRWICLLAHSVFLFNPCP